VPSKSCGSCKTGDSLLILSKFYKSKLPCDFRLDEEKMAAIAARDMLADSQKRAAAR
jgi:hypothetical protein